MNSNLKLIARYAVIGTIIYLAYLVTSPEWLAAVNKLDPMNINVIIGSVFGGLTMVVREHMNTKIQE